jgi:integrase
MNGIANNVMSGTTDIQLGSIENRVYGINKVICGNIQKTTPFTIADYIQKFLDRDVSIGTLMNYRYDIIDFFGCDIDAITLEQVIGVSVHDAEMYRDRLIENGYNLGTVKVKISRIKALYTFLMGQTTDNASRVKVFMGNPFATVSLNVKGKHRTENNQVKMYGDLTRHEVSALLKVAIRPYDLFYEMAARTGVRKAALLNLKFEDVVMIDGIWCIHVKHDKTVDDLYEAITNEMYDKIKKYTSCVEGESIFKIDGSTLNRNLAKDLIRIGISAEEQKDRKLCIHSFKKASVNMASEVSGGNLEVMKNKAHHSDINLTINTYAIKKYNPGKEPSLSYDLGFENVDDELESRLKGMSAWEIRELILGMNSGVRKAILNAIDCSRVNVG